MRPQILLTFDLEEFDLPLEFGCPVTDEEQISISVAGLARVTGILSKYNLPATFFTTSFFAGKNEGLIRNLSEFHEIASHSKHHTGFTETDPSDSKNEIEGITGKTVSGFRMPRFRKTDLSLLQSAGYKYDSSVNPTFVPGRYNNLFTQRKIHSDPGTGLLEVPVSVSPLIRFPLFWLSFKNIPFPVYLNMCKRALRRDSYLNLCFHPWEFADLGPVKIPEYLKTPSGDKLIERFEKLIAGLSREGDFSTVSGFLRKKGL